ncbi:hypothetical protein FRX31_033272 [Thalictrum thalictroides]|uniref:Uncharacterized protein n=1 Tax=Thalictrum thalictroides TaxID=46969 RepID=A0A7J6UXD3_THATH|nr:hypothetical protein FRX31_033272 [Thalictrum thalictroides]
MASMTDGEELPSVPLEDLLGDLDISDEEDEGESMIFETGYEHYGRVDDGCARHLGYSTNVVRDTRQKLIAFSYLKCFNADLLRLAFSYMKCFNADS